MIKRVVKDSFGLIYEKNVGSVPKTILFINCLITRITELKGSNIEEIRVQNAVEIREKSDGL